MTYSGRFENVLISFGVFVEHVGFDVVGAQLRSEVLLVRALDADHVEVKVAAGRVWGVLLRCFSVAVVLWVESDGVELVLLEVYAVRNASSPGIGP